MTRSCLICHQRKIRCDKLSPCSSCVRGNVLCSYPGPERTARRLHKMTINDVAARVSRLEGRISEISNPSSGTALSYPTDNPVTPLSHEDLAAESSVEEHSSAEDHLVENGDSSHYVNEVLFSRILDEEPDLQSVMGSPKGDTNKDSEKSSFDLGNVFSEFRKPAASDRVSHPPRWHVIQLWRAYINNVDPVIKILHVPTMNATVFAVANDAINTDDELDALLFSIYFAAATSLSSEDVANILGQQRATALRRFKRGIEQSLAAANFLDRPSMRSLQAMTIYLNCLRAHNPGRSTWTLYGLIMRSAQSIGLHRDGSNFKLSPFKSEMRRRLWFIMTSAELRAGEDHGISINTNLDKSCDTKVPSNLNDCDLSVEMQELPASRSGWTEMTMSLSISHAFLSLHRSYSDSVGNLTSDQSSNDQILHNLGVYLEETFIKHCNPDIPIQRLTIMLSRIMVAKVGFVTRQQLQKCALSSSGSGSTATEDSLVTACEILEMDLQLQTEDLIRDFAWISRTYIQYFPLTYVLWHLCVKPTGPNAERAWHLSRLIIEAIGNRDTAFEGGSNWMIVKVLRQRVIRIREAAMGTAAYMECANLEGIPEGLPAADSAFWDIGATDFADWSNLIKNLDVHGFDM